MTPRVLIAEDEPLMRERLVALLAEVWPEAEIVAVAADGLDAWDAWVEHAPDVAFLDIRMPGMSGLDLAARMTAGARPDTRRAPLRIVFVTAYESHAVEAFERGAIDYLLKPIERERLALTVQRLTTAAASADNLAAVLRSISAGAAEPERTKWIKASAGRRIRLIKIADVRFFQADSKYTRVVCHDGDAFIRTPLRELVGRLDPEVFWQIHRSAVVNVDAIAAAERVDPDRLEVVIKDTGERLPVSRPFFHLFREE